MAKGKLVSIIIIVGAIAFLLKLLILNNVINSNPNSPYVADSIRYLEPAANLDETGILHLDGLGNQYNPLQVAPGYPFFIHLIRKFLDDNIFPLIAVQAALTSVVLLSTSLSVFLLSGSHKATISASVISLVDPLMTYYSGVVMTEALFTFWYSCTSLFGVYLLVSINSPARRYLSSFALGIALASCTLIRPITEYLPYLIGICILLFCPLVMTHGRKFISTVIISLLCILPPFAAVTYWQEHNKSLTGIALVTDNSSENILNWKAAGLKAYQQGISREEAVVILNRKLKSHQGYSENIPYSELLKIKTEVGVGYILEHKVDYIIWSFKDLIKILMGTANQSLIEWFDLSREQTSQNNSTQVTQPSQFIDDVSIDYSSRFRNIFHYPSWYIALQISTLIFLLVVYLSALKLLFYLPKLFTLKPDRFVAILFLLGLSAYLILLSTGHASAYSRYRVPAMPLLIVLASLGLFIKHMFTKGKD